MGHCNKSCAWPVSGAGYGAFVATWNFQKGRLLEIQITSYDFHPNKHRTEKGIQDEKLFLSKKRSKSETFIIKAHWKNFLPSHSVHKFNKKHTKISIFLSLESRVLMEKNFLMGKKLNFKRICNFLFRAITVENCYIWHQIKLNIKAEKFFPKKKRKVLKTFFYIFIWCHSIKNDNLPNFSNKIATCCVIKRY